jgi:hypothetical protein
LRGVGAGRSGIESIFFQSLPSQAINTAKNRTRISALFPNVKKTITCNEIVEKYERENERR